ncbi:hypothetical protein [Myroides sp. A21]|uniref:hypothetical protein n=1 Tax=Myroides sp. A21 TaxID=1583100 RepID=UPI00057CB3EF|nr:hypothetical protein [Myroides sp. A21]
MAKYLNDLLEHATSQGYKSNVIKPLVGILIVFLCGLIAASYFNTDKIILYVLVVLTGICGLMVLVAYFYCLINNPDLLRSERYNIEKTAIEKVSFTGDSSSRSKLKINMPSTDYVIIEGKGQSKEESINE